MDAAKIRAYYDQTWFDYRWLWLNPNNRAIHFGYWDEKTRNHADSLVRMNRVMAERIMLRNDEHVLDAGCGVGGAAIWLAENYGARVTGVTLVASQVERAQRYAQVKGVEHLVQFDQQDYCTTNFTDASFDVLWVQESACHAASKRAFLAEAYRVLKPSGRLVVLEYFRFARPYADGDERLLHSWLAGWMIPDIATGDEWVRWACEIGFENVELENIEMHVKSSHRRLYVITTWLFWGEWFLHALGLRSNIQHGNTRGARDQWRALERSLWFEGIFTARKPSA
jgi:tocopherol O-methyltransferase